VKPFQDDLKNLYQHEMKSYSASKLFINAHARVMEFAECNSVFCASDNKAIVLLPTHTEGNNMATASKLMLGAVIAAVSIASPALAAHKSKPISAHQNGYLTQSSYRTKRLSGYRLGTG
jgi:hypothetical protein